MTFYEPDPAVESTGAEAGEFVDDGPLSAPDDAEADPTRRPTGSVPVHDETGDDDVKFDRRE